MSMLAKLSRQNGNIKKGAKLDQLVSKAKAKAVQFSASHILSPYAAIQLSYEAAGRRA
jgi:hypothetical protein